MNKGKQSRREFMGKVVDIAGSAGLLGMVSGSMLTATQAKTEKLIALSNQNLTVTIDTSGGQITALHNKWTGEHHQLESVEFAIVSDHGTQTADRMVVTGIEHKADSLAVTLEGGGYHVQIHYLLGEAWIEKWISLTSNTPLMLKRIVLGNRKYTPAFREIYAHSDHTAYSVPINWFLRSAKGGWYTGIEFPFTVGEQSDSRLSLAYGGWQWKYDLANRHLADMVDERPASVGLADMNVALKPGETLTSEREFLGVYQNTGSFRVKAMTGTPRILTTTAERLDWGEVWAMQAFMRQPLPPLPANHEGFLLYMNGWWAGLPGGPITPPDLAVYKKAIDQSKELGADVFAFSPTWMGMAEFFKRSAPFVESVGKDLEFSLSPSAQQAVEYVESRGMVLAPYSEAASSYREDRPDWKLVNPAGTKLGQLCWANPEPTDWFFKLHRKIFDTFKAVKFWGWDGGWLPGEPEELLPDQQYLSWECHSTEHGHVPGNISYQAYQNVMSFFRRLRTERPQVETIVAWAVKCGGPWALRYIDSHENFYENEGPDDLRFQMWYNQNSSFLPCEKNMAQIWFKFSPSTREMPEKSQDYWKIWYTKQTRDYVYGLMSALSGGVDFGYIVQLPQFDSDTEKETYLAFLRQWKKWASENLAYLKVKRDLFGQPLRQGGIDGNAHVIKNRGFIFIFNPTEERHIGRIPLDQRILLTTGENYEVRVIHPPAQGSLGSFQHGSSVLVDMPPGTCKVLQIGPSQGPAIASKIPTGADIQDAF